MESVNQGIKKMDDLEYRDYILPRLNKKYKI